MLVDLNIKSGSYSNDQVKEILTKAFNFSSPLDVEINNEDFVAVKFDKTDIDNSVHAADPNLDDLSFEEKMEIMKVVVYDNDDSMRYMVADAVNYEVECNSDDLYEILSAEKEKAYNKLDPVTRFRKEFKDFVSCHATLEKYAFWESYDSERNNNPHKFTYECIFPHGGGLNAEIEFDDVKDLVSKIIKSLPTSVENMVAVGGYDYSSLPKNHKKDCLELFRGIDDVKDFCQCYLEKLEQKSSQGIHR